mgnify:CR=1 FL=1
MELYKEILTKVFATKEVKITFSDLQIDPKEIVEMQCYRVLQKIKTVIQDDSLTDNECFMKIEEIVGIFETLGSNGGTRHDFG